MPFIFNEDELTEGGMKGLRQFTGQLRELQPDVEGKFGLQGALHFYDVEVEDAEADVSLPDGTFTDWVKQTNSKKGTQARMIADWKKFAVENKIGVGLPNLGLPASLYDLKIRWKKVTYEFGESKDGEAMTPGKAWVPIELIETKKPAAKAPTAKTPVKAPTKTAKPAPAASEDAVEECIMATLGTDGATLDMIRKALLTKKALVEKVKASGGTVTVMKALVDAGKVTEDNGFYTVATANTKPADEEDPF